MLLDIDRDDVVKEFDSIFEAIIVAAKRARNVKKEGRLLEEYKGTKDVSFALEEILAGKIKSKHEQE